MVKLRLNITTAFQPLLLCYHRAPLHHAPSPLSTAHHHFPRGSFSLLRASGDTAPKFQSCFPPRVTVPVLFPFGLPPLDASPTPASFIKKTGFVEPSRDSAPRTEVLPIGVEVSCLLSALSLLVCYQRAF